MSSYQTSIPAGNTLPSDNAYYCCKCLYGPMVFDWHPACIECGTPACSGCSTVSLSQNNPGHLPESAPQDQTDPRDPYGASILGLNSTPSPMMDRFLQEEPNATERLLSGAVSRSLTGFQEEVEGIVRQMQYSGDETRPRM